ncbi:hypothetical protein AB0J43_07410 [Nonomuraea fuscirosea]
MYQPGVGADGHGIVAWGSDSRPTHLWLAPVAYRGAIASFDSIGEVGLMLWRDLTEHALMTDHRLVNLGDVHQLDDAPNSAPDSTRETRLSARTAALPVRGVLSVSEQSIVSAAELADRLGLPGFGVQAARTLHDRGRTHSVLREVDLPLPVTLQVDTLSEAIKAAAALSYPLSVAPAERHLGVARLVRNPAHLTASINAAMIDAGEGGSVVIQSANPAATVMLWCMTRDGHTQVIAARRTLHRRSSCGCLAGHLVDAADHVRTDAAIAQHAAAALETLGVRNGLSRVTMEITTHGPVIVEVSPGFGEASDVQLVRIATGIDLGRLSIAIALGSSTGPVTDLDFRCAMQVMLPGQRRARSMRERLGDIAAMSWAKHVTWICERSHRCPHPSALCPAPIAAAIVAGWDPAQCLHLAAITQAKFAGTARV